MWVYLSALVGVLYVFDLLQPTYCADALNHLLRLWLAD